MPANIPGAPVASIPPKLCQEWGLVADIMTIIITLGRDTITWKMSANFVINVSFFYSFSSNFIILIISLDSASQRDTMATGAYPPPRSVFYGQ